MIFYDKIYLGSDPKEAEKQNIFGISSALNTAIEQNEYFVLISSSAVFDRSLPRVYSERSKPNSKSVAAKLLIESENRVLEYKYGFVVRVQDKFSSITPDLDRMMGLKEDPILIDDSFWIIMDEYVDVLIRFVLFHNDNKLFHVCSEYAFTSEMIWFLLKEQNPNTSQEGMDFVMSGFSGRICSETLSSIPLYKDLMLMNKKKVAIAISSYKR